MGTTLFGSTIQVLEKSLDLRKANHHYLASNIANAHTPGYAPSRLQFEQQLQEAVSGQEGMRSTHARHFGFGQGRVQEVEGSVVTEEVEAQVGDQNGVRIQEEMVRLAENQIKYEAASRMLKGTFSSMQYVIQGGK